MKVESFTVTLHRQLRDDQVAVTYLREAIQDGLDAFLEAIRDLVEARGAESAGVVISQAVS